MSIFFKIAINTRDVDLRFGFRLCAIVFRYCDAEVEHSIVLSLVASHLKEDSGHGLGFRLWPIQRAGAVAMVLRQESQCVDNFWDFLKLRLPYDL